MHQIRNFCILAHVDHGKSTLADRFLELTGTVPKEKMREQYLDMMDLERERGITIKMQPVRMTYKPDNDNDYYDDNKRGWDRHSHRQKSSSDSEYILNLIDTPGHVDFSYEVSRALAAVEGALLLVDATKGIQAQTIANYELARKEGLVIIPVVNKIDAANARTEETVAELAQLLQKDPSKVLLVSAKYGTNVEQLFHVIVEEIPPPKTEKEKPLRALVFDSTYDAYKGVIAFVRIMEGSIKAEEKIFLMATQTDGVAKEVGFFAPGFSPQAELSAGEIGYIATGIKEVDKVRIGDTITEPVISHKSPVTPLSGYQEPRPVVFASFYPEDADDYDTLKDAFSKLHLQDPSFSFEPESRESLGRGFRCGFLGTLHLEIVAERLRREFQLRLAISSPSVAYKIFSREGDAQWAYSPADWPEYCLVKRVEEPWVKLEILVPAQHLGRVTEVLKDYSGAYLNTSHMADKIVLLYEMPLRELLRGFYSKLKGVTQGYGSLNYELVGWREGDLVKLEILIAGRKEEAFSQIVAREEAYGRAKVLVRKLKELLPQQQFTVALQAQVEGRIIARETIKASRKDVTAPLYGGDVTRKHKLLEKQKRGKKELKERGQLHIPQKTFIEISKSIE